MAEDEPDGDFHLPGGVLGHAKRKVFGCGLIHLAITVGKTEPIEIKPPDIEAGLVERVAPRFAIEPMRD